MEKAEETSGLRVEEIKVDEKAREKQAADFDLNRQMQELAKSKDVMKERHNVLELFLELEKPAKTNADLEEDKNNEDEVRD